MVGTALLNRVRGFGEATLLTHYNRPVGLNVIKNQSNGRAFGKGPANASCKFRVGEGLVVLNTINVFICLWCVDVIR